MPAWKTIITYLVEGDPMGIKTLELSNWVWKGIVVPRSKLKQAKQRPEMSQPAIYFLFGEDENGEIKVYIWESEKLIDRVYSHDSKKDWWNLLIAFISKDNNLTKSDIKYLEHMSVQKAKEAERFKLENKAIPDKNVLPEYRESEMQEFLDNMDILISAAGYPVFKPWYVKQSNNKEQFFYLKKDGIDAKWVYSPEWFVILKWSTGRYEVSDYFKDHYFYKLRDKLVEQWIINIENDEIVFKQSYKFSSPSAASSVLLWRNSNWRKEWKTKNGKTLDEIYRQT